MNNQAFAIVTIEFDAMHTARQWYAQAEKERPYKVIANRAAAIIRKARKEQREFWFYVTSNKEYLARISNTGSYVYYPNGDFMTPELSYIVAACRNALAEDVRPD